jgi:hypothetical protein
VVHHVALAKLISSIPCALKRDFAAVTLQHITGMGLIVMKVYFLEVKAAIGIRDALLKVLPSRCPLLYYKKREKIQ